MERIMRGVSFRDRIRNEEIRTRTKNGPRKIRRSVGIPQKRSVDDIRATSGKQWIRVAQDTNQWKRMNLTC